MATPKTSTKTGAKKIAAKPAKKSGRQRASTKSAEAAARKAVIATSLQMSRSGLSPGRSGNVSCRWHSGMLITPTGMPYEELKPADIVFVDGNGESPARARKPSSEWRFHLSAYKARPDMGAVVHTHSLHATVLACAHKPIPAFHYMIAIAGGPDIPLIPYAPFGTQELAALVADGLQERNALLMANHGQIAIAKDLDSALELATEVEVLAEQFYKVLTLGKPKVLGRKAMADVLQRFQSYGQNAKQS
jgi:L-fuculose-phosphate aldolase